MKSILHGNDTVEAYPSNDGCSPAHLCVAPHKCIAKDRWCVRLVNVKDPKTILAIRMRVVTVELQDRNIPWVNFHGCVYICASCADFGTEPNTISSACDSTIIEDAVLSRNYPKSRRSLICVQKIHTRDRFDCKITVQDIVFLYSILYEKRMPHNAVNKVADQAKEVDAVHGSSSIPAVVNGDIALEGLFQIANHVPVNCISAQPESLACISQLKIFQPVKIRVICKKSTEHVSASLNG